MKTKYFKEKNNHKNNYMKINFNKKRTNNFRYFIVSLVIFASVFINTKTWAQVTIVNAHLNSFNITPSSICEVSVMCYAADARIVMEAKVLNSSNEVLIRAESSPFMITQGLNTLTNVPIGISEFGTSAQALQLQSTHVLPSGTFHYCCKIVVVSSEGGDEYCDIFDSDVNINLNLIYPDDKDTIETKNPVLMWMHNEPFNVVASGEYFKMIVVELTAGQSAESGVLVNNPVFEKIGLTSHNEPYPFNAVSLKDGSRYGWQVQRITNGVVTDKTEAWEFTVKPPEVFNESKYATLRKTLDAGYYKVENDKIFFRFDEEYTGDKISCTLYNSKREKMIPSPVNEDKTLSEIAAKKTGANYYVINLDELSNISSGFYTLEVRNQKGDLFLLKCYVE